MTAVSAAASTPRRRRDFSSPLCFNPNICASRLPFLAARSTRFNMNNRQRERMG
jgi:hypothetical protein